MQSQQPTFPQNLLATRPTSAPKNVNIYPKSTLQMDFASIKFHGGKKAPYIGFNLIVGMQYLQKNK